MLLPPRWRQPRFLAGLGIVAASVLLGVALISGGENEVTVWAADHDVAPGTALTAEDLVAVPVQVAHHEIYVTDPSEVIGRRVNRQLRANELLPLSAIETGVVARRQVTMPVEPIHAPTQLRHGDRVDVYVSPRDAVASGASRLVAAGVLIADVSADIDSATGEYAVIVDVDPQQVSPLVSASRGGVIDLVRVPAGTQ